jgi:hypothetical protein
MLCLLFDAEDGGSLFLWNVMELLQDNRVSHPIDGTISAFIVTFKVKDLQNAISQMFCLGV